MNHAKMTRLFRFYAGAYDRIARALETADGQQQLTQALSLVSHWQVRMRKVHVAYMA